MLIRIVDAVAYPTQETPGVEVWSYGAGTAEDSVAPAAALVTFTRDLEVGTWYNYNYFKEKIGTFTYLEQPIWTTVDVLQSGPEGQWTATLEVEQIFAIRALTSEVMKYVDRLHRGKNLWVRVD